MHAHTCMWHAPILISAQPSLTSFDGVVRDVDEEVVDAWLRWAELHVYVRTYVHVDDTHTCIIICTMYTYVQWNFSIVDTTGPRKHVLIREASLFQRLICTQEYTIGTSETVLIREVSLFQRLICTQE